jgi:hypothetical protein
MTARRTRRGGGRFSFRPTNVSPPAQNNLPLHLFPRIWACPRCGDPCTTDENWNAKQQCCCACTRSKHRAIPIVIDGLYFHSRKEANRYQELRYLERAGEISNLQRQVPFPFYVTSGLEPEEAAHLHQLLMQSLSTRSIEEERGGPDQAWLERLRLKLCRMMGEKRESIGTYVADHVYTEAGERIVEDVNSSHTRTLPEYRRNRRFMRICYGITIREV